MSLKINYSKKTEVNTSKNIVLFVDEKFNTSRIGKNLLPKEISYINDLLKTNDLKKKIIIFEMSSKKNVILISSKKDLKISDIENLGAEFYEKIKYGKNSEYNIISESVSIKKETFLGHFLHGLKLKSYEFNKYKSKKENRLFI